MPLDDLPRGIWLNNNVNGAGTASITFGAYPGISWVLSEITAFLVNTADASGYSTTVAPAASPGGPVLALAVQASPLPFIASVDWSGRIQYPLGVAMTVTFGNAAVAGIAQYLNVYAYPI